MIKKQKNCMIKQKVLDISDTLNDIFEFKYIEYFIQIFDGL